ncbi:MAG TPA: CmcJ/NvfI family oxidoreductase [Stellaceae bacterium]|nr:CmcJ/NvfI family oxidoreductase [Stellaceae bacterium]
MRPARALSRPAFEDLPFVEAELLYLVPMAEKPWQYTYEPPAGVPRMNSRHAPQRLPIRDARPIASDLSLDRDGFALLRHRTDLGDFDDADERRRVYDPEIERLVAEATGAERVVVFDHTIRRRIWSAADRMPATPRQPVPRVHNDYTLRSGPQRVRDLMGEEAEALLQRRFAIINVWRPIRGPLRDAPLAVCDAQSTELADFVAADLIYPDRRGETYSVTYNPRHRWFYAPAMGEDEVMLLKVFDSAADGRARFAPHSAFEDPTAPADVLPRESIESRTLAFFSA